MPSPHWISHRGLRLDHPENSLVAFDAALAAGFMELETDLRLSKDGQLVLCHDPDLKRILGIDANVADLTLQELEAQNVTTFDAFAATFSDTPWLLDIKSEQGYQIIDHLCDWIDGYGVDKALTQSRFLFWEKGQQEAFLARFPEAVCMPRMAQCYRAGIANLCFLPGLGGIEPGLTYALTPSFLGIDLLNKAFVNRLQRSGARVLAFLPQGLEALDLALSAGVDEILSDGWIKRSVNSGPTIPLRA